MTRTDDKLNVLILAAGLGTRLRPLTSEIPKPLVRVYDKSILEIQMERAKSLGDVRLHANAHYLADQIVSEGERLGFERVWVEMPEILGTAGPLRSIYAAGYRGGLLIMNGDAYCSFDLQAFVRCHCRWPLRCRSRRWCIARRVHGTWWALRWHRWSAAWFNSVWVD